MLGVQLLIVTPYTYGALAKCNPDWLLRAEPVRSWAPDMLQSADDALGGRVLLMIDRFLPPDADIVPPFAALVSACGLIFDLLV